MGMCSTSSMAWKSIGCSWDFIVESDQLALFGVKGLSGGSNGTGDAFEEGPNAAAERQPFPGPELQFVRSMHRYSVMDGRDIAAMGAQEEEGPDPLITTQAMFQFAQAVQNDHAASIDELRPGILVFGTEVEDHAWIHEYPTRGAFDQQGNA